MSKKREAFVDHEMPEADEQNVNKIRDILFGGQMRDYEERFVRLEQAFQQHSERLAADFARRIEKLEAFARTEFAQLDERVAAEREARAGERERGKQELERLRGAMQAAIDALERQGEGQTRGLREAIEAQGARLAEQLQATREELGAELRERARAFDEVKLSREDLAALFHDVARRLASSRDRADG